MITKKRPFFLLSIIILFFNINSIYAQQTENFIMEDSECPIYEISKANNLVQIAINMQSPQAQEIVLKINNFTSETIGQPNPSTDSNTIKQNQKKLGIDYQTVSQQLNLDNQENVYQVIDQLETVTPGIYPKINSEGLLVFQISQADWIENNQEVVIKLFDKRIIALEKIDDNTLSYQNYQLIHQ
ncbi:hypothetical protein [Ignavigranum ruoffiae]|uniref:hypothetical protein n=1 Tax=Ignavigranum ruoffiae TaxID=89093 RepID=UPI0024ADBC26|nr:hypothetical protein [Ignavigranum ruoffiae]